MSNSYPYCRFNIPNPKIGDSHAKSSSFHQLRPFIGSFLKSRIILFDYIILCRQAYKEPVTDHLATHFGLIATKNKKSTMPHNVGHSSAPVLRRSERSRQPPNRFGVQPYSSLFGLKLILLFEDFKYDTRMCLCKGGGSRELLIWLVITGTHLSQH